jgi:hypothetical protein
MQPDCCIAAWVERGNPTAQSENLQLPKIAAEFPTGCCL